MSTNAENHFVVVLLILCKVLCELSNNYNKPVFVIFDTTFRLSITVCCVLATVL